MGKIFVVLSEEDLLVLEGICLDKDPQEALEFVLKRIAPKTHKPLPCLAGQLMRGR